MSNSPLQLVLSAVKFAADKHRQDKRKDGTTPYINHPIEVAEMIVRVGGVDDPLVLAAAILHDTVEDTNTSPEEIAANFGAEVRDLVMECTDDKSLPKQVRKELQVQHAPEKSPGARLIKIADKISNVRDIAFNPPPDWSLQRREEYLDWSERVIDGMRGANRQLEALYDESLQKARAAIRQAK